MRTNQTRLTQRDKVNFKLRQNEIGIYSTTDIKLDDVPADYLNKFTPEEIEKAKELKAKQLALFNADPTNNPKPNYTDSFYLDYARSLTKEYVLGRMREIHKNRASQYEINDMNWAQYSYEEIIQMENDGYDIPQHVLEWAHAQQQADVTDYIVLSENVESDDDSVTTDVTSSDELSKLRAQSLNDIAKVEKAEQETQEQVQQYRDNEKQAKSIQKQKEDSYKKEFEKINDMTKEWKELNDKKQSGEKLSKKDENRLKQLSGLLNGENGKITKRIEADVADLDEFIQNLNLLNEKIEKNNEIVTKTIQNAQDLSSIEKQYRPSKLPWVNTGIRIDGNGLSLNTLYGIRLEEISAIAIKKGTDLNKLSDLTLNHLLSDKNEKLINFATEYTNDANKVNQNTQAVMGDKFNEQSAKDSQNNQSQEKYTVMPIFSAVNSVTATATTQMAHADMFANQKTNDKQAKNLDKQVKIANNEVKDLEQESSVSASEHEQNLTKEEQFLLELEALNQEENSSSQSTMPANNDNSTEIVQAAVQEQEENSNQTNETNPSNINNASNNIQKAPPEKNTKNIDINENNKKNEKTAITEQIISIADNNSKITNKIEKLAQKAQSANIKGANLLNNLSNATDNFEASRKTAQNVSTATTAVGIGTVVLGHGHMTEGVALTAIGTSMAASFDPFTKMYGLKLIKDGNILTGMGVAEVLTGTIATVTGVEGLSAAATAKAITTTGKLTEKFAQKTLEANQAIITTSQKAVGIEPVKNSTNSQNNNQTQTRNDNQEQIQDYSVTPQISGNSNSPAPLMPSQNLEINSNENEIPLNTTQEKINPVLTSNVTNSTQMSSTVQQVDENTDTEEENETETINNTNNTEQNTDNNEKTNNISNNQNTDDNEVLTSDITNSTDNTTEETTTNPENETEESVQDNPSENQTTEIDDTGSRRISVSNNIQTSTDKADNEKNQENSDIKTDDKSDKGQQQSTDGYSVEKDFSLPSSLKAIATSMKATSDVQTESVTMRQKESLFLQRLQVMQQINKDIEKNKSITELILKSQESKAAQANAQIEIENENIKEASVRGNTDDIEEAEANVEKLQAQVIENSSDKQVTQYISNIDRMNGADKVAQSAQSDLTNNLSDMNKMLSQQRQVSQDTTIVGAGTSVVGLAHNVMGVHLFTGGQALAASAGLNFTQLSLGLDMMTRGILLSQVGMLEQATGITATATGTNGIVNNSLIQTQKSISDSSEKVGKSFLSLTRSGTLKEVANTQEIQKQEAQIMENVSIASASATANVDTTNIVETDDKEDRKLVRFNKETELLSRKKRKKVNAVSSSARG